MSYVKRQVCTRFYILVVQRVYVVVLMCGRASEMSQLLCWSIPFSMMENKKKCIFKCSSSRFSEPAIRKKIGYWLFVWCTISTWHFNVYIRSLTWLPNIRVFVLLCRLGQKKQHFFCVICPVSLNHIVMHKENYFISVRLFLYHSCNNLIIIHNPYSFYILCSNFPHTILHIGWDWIHITLLSLYYKNELFPVTLLIL